MKQIYFDAASTTPVSQEVADYISSFYTQTFGNPSSEEHLLGQVAKAAFEITRKRFIELIGGGGDVEIVYTSGATESINMILRGVYEKDHSKNHFISCSTEHSAVLETLKSLSNKGAKIDLINPRNEFQVLTEIESKISSKTAMVSCMYVNNETGDIFPVEEICKLCREKGVLFLCDATQALAKIDIDIEKFRADFIAFSGHKFGSPKGIGGVIIRKGREKCIEPLITGGSQQMGHRAGTINLPLIAGMTKALEHAIEKNKSISGKELIQIYEKIPSVNPKMFLHSFMKQKVPQIINFGIEGVSQKELKKKLKPFIFSTGSACRLDKDQPSPVLLGFGTSSERAKNAIRISLGTHNTLEEVELLASFLQKI